MGALLTTGATLMCPHGGMVSVLPAQSQVTLAGAPALTAADTFIVGGCPFIIPVAEPSPCVTVQWILTDTASTAGGNPTLSSDSVGLCSAASGAVQGPVIISDAGQAQATSL